MTSQTTPARASTAGVNQRAQRSAVRTMGARSASASLTRVAIRPRAVPSPVRVVATCRAPPVARVPANTSAPGPFSAGSDSPVIAASSTAARPETTRPSTGTRSPGRTSDDVPGAQVLHRRHRPLAPGCPPASSTCAVAGTSRPSPSSACSARAAVTSSSTLPKSIMNATRAAPQYSPT